MKTKYLFLFFNPFPNKPWFIRVCSIHLLKTLWEKEKLLETSNFSFSHSIFYPFQKLPAMFITFQNAICTLFQFGSLNFVVWERVIIQFFIATQGVGTHHKKLGNTKLPLHQNFIITHIDNFIV